VVIFSQFFLAFLFPLIWVIFFARKDRNREPFVWLFFAFALGIISALVSYVSQKFVFQYMIESESIGRILLAVFIEEFFKFFVIWFFIYPQKVVDEPVDAMVYVMFSALGFAFTENVFYLLNLKFSQNYGDIFIFVTLLLRFLGANLLHILASSLIGYGYASWLRTRRFFGFFVSFIAGVSLHFLYNYLIIKSATFNSSNNLFGFIVPILWTSFLVVLNELDYLTLNGRAETRRNINS
jgi:RsiW-degrading membrane proteinase PrsW (M82 family)